uniref:hypothetical protein n=1 Tax=Lentilactobacillus hilgardii TaxID=1588 RepID=UPI00403F1F67
MKAFDFSGNAFPALTDADQKAALQDISSTSSTFNTADFFAEGKAFETNLDKSATAVKVSKDTLTDQFANNNHPYFDKTGFFGQTTQGGSQRAFYVYSPSD